MKEIQERLAASYHKKAKHEITAGLNLVMQAVGSRLTQPATSTTAPSSENPASKEWDVFICHASEDKEDVVEPLAEALRARGLRVWYDRWVLNIGDSLRRKIDEGLSSSRYGIVILSKAFLGKKAWTERELDGLVQREISGKKVILPVWHRVTREEVAQYSPPLADKLAGSTEVGIDQLADELVRAIAQDLSEVPSGQRSRQRRRAATEEDLAQFRDACVGGDPEERLSALKDVEALSYHVRIDENPEVRGWISYALRGRAELRIQAMRTVRTFLSVVDAASRDELVRWAQELAREQFDKAKDPSVKTEALNLLGMVVTTDDLDRLIEHVVESPPEIYDTSRPFFPLDALKNVAPVRRELYRARREVEDPKIKARIDELLEHIRVQH